MQKLKKSYGIYLSAFLLVAFSAVLLPLDIFHNHDPFLADANTKQLKSSDKEGISSKNNADYCWVCSVHFDKTFTKTNFTEKVKLSPVMSVFLNNQVTGYVAELLISGLRGPPSE